LSVVKGNNLVETDLIEKERVGQNWWPARIFRLPEDRIEGTF